MRVRFADSVYFLALLNERDALHPRAVAAARESAVRVVTTAWILCELLDACSRYPLRTSVGAFVRRLRADRDTLIVDADRDLFEQGFELFLRRPDKDWSMTDCTSFVVMRRKRIRDALTADRHFRQAGFTALLA